MLEYTSAFAQNGAAPLRWSAVSPDFANMPDTAIAESDGGRQAAPPTFLDGGGDMGARIRAYD